MKTLLEKMQKKEVDVLKHELVPEHRVLSEEEVDELLKKYSISLSQLPIISINDVVVQRIGAKVGDVIEIKRKSPTAGIAKYYRVVRIVE